eukprot:947932-Rhodomonas_salina.1
MVVLSGPLAGSRSGIPGPRDAETADGRRGYACDATPSLCALALPTSVPVTLRVRYAVPGTEIRYAAPRWRKGSPYRLAHTPEWPRDRCSLPAPRPTVTPGTPTGSLVPLVPLRGVA